MRIEPGLTGARFLRLSAQLPRYDGAVRRRLEMEQHETQENRYSDDDSGFTPGQTMSMSEALSKTPNDADMAVLSSLNRDSHNSALGALFEYETG